eukprot:UN23590
MDQTATCEVRGQSVEEFFALLKVCGIDFEEECRRTNLKAGHPHFLDKQFLRIQEVTADKLLKPRIRFKIKDLIDLKNKHWESNSHSEMDPKFLSDIRAEIKNEQRMKQRLLANLRKHRQAARSNQSFKEEYTGSDVRLRSGFRGSGKIRAVNKIRSKKRGLVRIAEHGHCPRIDKIKWTKIVKGLRHEDYEKMFKKKDPTKTPRSDTKSVDETSQTSGLSGPNGACSTASNGTFEDNESTSVFSNSDADSLDSHPSPFFIDKVSEDALLEYYDSGDLENAGRCIKEAIVQGYKPERVIYSAINITVDKGPRERIELNKYFEYLFGNDIITSDIFYQGLLLCLRTMDDWKLDVPKLDEYFTEWLTRWTKANIVDTVELEKLSAKTSQTSKLWSHIIINKIQHSPVEIEKTK